MKATIKKLKTLDNAELPNMFVDEDYLGEFHGFIQYDDLKINESFNINDKNHLFVSSPVQEIISKETKTIGLKEVDEFVFKTLNSIYKVTIIK